MNQQTNSLSWDEYKKTMHVEGEHLFDLARNGDIQGLVSLMDKILDIDQKNSKGHSLLMLAAYNGHFELSRVLIENGADVNSVDESGNSILMGVAFKGHAMIVNLLLQNGANANYKNSKGQSALQFAEMFARRDVAKILATNTGKQNMILNSIKSWTSFIGQQFLGGRK